MPGTQPNNDLWLAQQIAQLKRDVAALKAQRTQFIIDASNQAQAIIGNLAHDPSGTATGLTGFGLAVWDGLSWQDVSSAVTVARGTRTAALTIPAAAWTKIPLDTATFNPGGHLDIATNHRYNVPANGYYQVNAQALISVSATGTYTECITAVYKNGTEAIGDVTFPAIETYQSNLVADIIECTAGDYLEMYAYSSQGGPLNPSTQYTYMSVCRAA